MMNQQDIFKKIGNILSEINEQYQFLAQNPDQLNDLEVELFLANANFLSDHVQIVKKLNVLKHETKPTKATDNLLLVEQNTIVLPHPTQSLDNKTEVNQQLNDVAKAEEEEERIDVEQEQEQLDNYKIHEITAEKVLERDFFKPDQDDHSFEFVLGNHDDEDKFDYEAKSVEDIFDRPLSKAEEEILAQKKKIHDKEDSSIAPADNILVNEEDEIGPEPFLISQEEEAVFTEPEIQANEPIEALRNVNFDEDVISPPVVEEKPAFIPQSVLVKPIVEAISSKPTPSLNDLLAKTHNTSSEPIKAPIADLKQGISLNEKLLFIKDLFNGYNLAYSEAIEIVNKMKGFEAADNFLQSNYAVKNNWAAKQSTVDQFYELLNRRFVS
ncbi:hypothetical protein [Pedobacter mucosus]|uniref:hypothetical protein n=1 Tax=Pedobacter mucosus TaxID=2895286 RepID=UPI001EE4BC14|nr:hypothetical protein [Pedobacter mucosus]UKT64551.1 hypothetical protein LOK61_01955 [Pedobacter mucosus]